MQTNDTMIEAGRTVLRLESDAVSNLVEQLDVHFAAACNRILACKGRVILIGMGKSGHIARKIAATLASTGTPAFFVHPAEAGHGDLGMITDKDCVLALSYSGQTRELLDLLPHLKRAAIPMIAMTGAEHSELANASDCFLSVHVQQEACQNGLAPTCSTTAMLAMGDALAVATSSSRNFTPSDFARSHPDGSLGKRVLLKIENMMRTGDALPIIAADMPVVEALSLISEKRLGLGLVVDQTGSLKGLFTDGDLRRTLLKKRDVHTTPVSTVMTSNFKTITPDTLATAALQMMETFKITALVVVDDQDKLCGIVHMHDLISAGVI